MAIINQEWRTPAFGTNDPGPKAIGWYQRGMLDPDVERQAKVQEMGLQQRQDRFNAIFPTLRDQMGALAAGFGAPGGNSGTGPEITVGPVWSDQQIQQQVNAGRAQNDKATQSRIRGMQQHVGASGFGSNSPLAMALQGQYQNQNLATNTALGRETRMNAQQANTDNIYRTQMGREQQYASRMDEDIRRRTATLNSYNALLSALSGMV